MTQTWGSITPALLSGRLRFTRAIFKDQRAGIFPAVFFRQVTRRTGAVTPLMRSRKQTSFPYFAYGLSPVPQSPVVVLSRDDAAPGLRTFFDSELVNSSVNWSRKRGISFKRQSPVSFLQDQQQKCKILPMSGRCKNVGEFGI